LQPGNVVWLNGTSSSGKTSIARALQEIMETPYLHTGIDHYLPRLPPTCFSVSDGLDPATFDHFLLVYGEGGVRTVVQTPDGETVYVDDVLTEVRLGPGAVKLIAGMYHAVAALSAAGIDVIVDDVVHDPRVLQAAVAILRHTPVLFVGLHLPRHVAEQRERDRGDRGPGGALAFYDRVHTHARYDLDLDTSLLSPEECARRIKHALTSGHPRTAVRSLASELPPTDLPKTRPKFLVPTY
jgi:chloramphenicol 3-O phosphotransferase